MARRFGSVEARERYLLRQRLYNKKRTRPQISRKKPKDDKFCIYCGVLFTANRTDQVSCRKRDKQHRPDETPKTVSCSCVVCNKKLDVRTGDYNRTMKQRGYMSCSSACTYIQKGISVAFECSTCGKVFYRGKCNQTSTAKFHFCSSDCQRANDEWRPRGIDSYLYKDGKKSMSRGDGWIATRRTVRARDGYTCQHCGITEEELGKRLDVHHIKPFKEFEKSSDANVLENLISLCPSCHHKMEVRTQRNK